MLNVKIITSTVRPARKGPVVAEWVKQITQQYKELDAEVLDLGEINLPLMNEPFPPILKKYQFEHTKKWSEKIEEADAFIFVVTEYNGTYPAPLKNALEYLTSEWGYKPAGVVCYSSGFFAGLRGAQHLKNDLLNFKTIAISELVTIQQVDKMITDNVFISNEIITSTLKKMILELQRWSAGLKMIKEN